MSNSLFLEVMSRGGPIMWGLLCISIIGAGIVIERIMAMRRFRVMPTEILDDLERLLKEARKKDADEGLIPAETSLGRILKRMVTARRRGKKAAENEAVAAGSVEVETLGRGMELLGTLSHIAPLLGLLGTVMGLLRAFASIASARTVDPSVVAGGVAEALLTTIFGLLIGIPLLIAYRLIRAKINRYALEFEEVALRAMRAMP